MNGQRRCGVCVCVCVCVCAYAQIEILLSYKKEGSNAICRNMDGSRDNHTKRSTSKTNTIWYHLYVESKIWHKWTHLWNRNILRDEENRLVVVKGEEGLGKERLRVGIRRCKLVYINNKVLLYSIGKYIQYPVINHDRNEHEQIYM